MEQMRIVLEQTNYGNFAFESEYDNEVVSYCQFLKKSYGWSQFFFKVGKWRFSNPTIIFMLTNKFPKTIVDPLATLFVQELDRKALEVIEIEKRAKKIKEATDSDIVIPGLKKDLYPYQKIGVEFFVNNGGRGILADSPGVGKTAQALAYLVKAQKNRTLVVCPASVKFAWESEVKKWTKLKSFVITSQTDMRDIPYDSHVIIINYDIVKKHLNELLKMKWDCLICDESHLCKTLGAIRSKAIKLLSRKIESVIMLDGTPVLSRPIELFNILGMIDPYVWNNYYDYAKRYCNGHQGEYGFDDKGASNLAELSDRISRYFLRRTKAQVLKELPPILPTIEMPIELSGKHLKDYVKVSKEFVKYLKENKGKFEKDVKKALQAEKLVRIGYLRQISAMGQVDAVKEQIDSIIEAGEKVLVFCSYNEPLQELNDYYWDNSVMISGKTDVDDRGPLVQKFQTDPETNVFFGGFLSAGVGITLTAACNVILIGYPWNPADVEQSINRVHRPGQESDGINVYQFFGRGTYDEAMKELLDEKQDVLNQVVDSQVVEKKEMSVDKLIEMLIKQNEHRKI